MKPLPFHTAHLTPFGRELLYQRGFDLEKIVRATKTSLLPARYFFMPPMAGGSGSASNWAETTTLAHWSGQDNASWANLSPAFMALCTTVPDSSKTGSSIVEASYTGYGRASVANTIWSAPSAGGAGVASSQTTASTISFANCTGGSSTITGYAYCTSVSAGNVIFWGSCSSTVISTSFTPANVQTGALVLNLL